MSLTSAASTLQNKIQHHHFAIGFSGASQTNMLECFQEAGSITEYIFYKTAVEVWNCRYYTGTTSLSINMKYRTISDTAWLAGTIN